MDDPQGEEGVEDEVVLVDEEDREVGLRAKADCHRHPVPLHRAFSVFLVDAAGRVLITKRSAKKATWPGTWSNACCSHPRPGESTAAAAVRRVREELGVAAELVPLFSFVYEARYDSTWGEHELDHVFLGRLKGEVRPDPNEIEDWRRLEASELRASIATTPEEYSPWFRLCADRVLDEAHARGLL